MKKLLYLSLFALMGGFAFISCSSDDGDAPAKQTDNTDKDTTSTVTPVDTTTTDTVANDSTEADADSIIRIVYSGSTATVSIPSRYDDEVTCSSGTSSNVVLTNTNTTEELTYEVMGSSTAGSLTISSDYKMTVNLNGVNLTSTKGEAMRFKCGKRIALVMADGSVNSFTDTDDGGAAQSADDSHKACIYTKGHLEILGAGTLNVTGNYKHAIASKEYLQIKKTVGTINIKKAASDAIHVGQFFQMNGGTVNIDANTLGDGVQVEFKTDDNDVVIPLTEDEENTGGVIISGGTLNITMAGDEDTKAIKADGDITISGGTFDIKANSNGSRGIQTDGDLTISEDDGTTSITIDAAGGLCTQAEDADDPHRCMGMKIGGNLTVYGGTVTVTNPGQKSRGIKVDGVYHRYGGSVDASIKN